MLALKIIGILLAVVFFAAFVALMLNLQVIFGFNTEGKLDIRAKISVFTVFDINKKKKKKTIQKTTKQPQISDKKKKSGKLAEYIKKKFGLDELLDANAIGEKVGAGGISESVNKIVTLLTLVMGEITWLLKKIRVQRFRILAICGGNDAADAAMEYGVVCAAVYPLVGYIETNLNTEKNSMDIQIGCDFENDAYFETDFRIRLRIIYVVRAVFRNAMALASTQQSTEA